MNAYLRSAAFFAVIVGVSFQANEAPAAEIGTATAAQNVVEGKLTGPTRPINLGDQVFLDETLKTGSSSSASIRFLDDTTLSMGAASSIKLDHFVYDPNRSASQIVFNAARGAFRFVSGKAEHKEFRLATPMASIGVRGTDFDLYIDRVGSTMVLARTGEATACPRTPAQNGQVNERCCTLAVSTQPLYGLLMSQGDRCLGPFPWDGSSPAAIMSGAVPGVARDNPVQPAAQPAPPPAAVAAIAPPEPPGRPISPDDL